MQLSEMFKFLGAPLRNVRWSWGSVRPADGTVFLRVWQNGTMKRNGNTFVWLSDPEGLDSSAGAAERREHLARILDGAPCYMIMCQAEDVNVLPRKVQSFNQRELFRGGDVLEVDGSHYLRLGDRVPVLQVRAAARE